MKPRTCPNCKKVIPIDQGFFFDEKLNMICDGCGKAIIATGWEKEPTQYNPSYGVSQSYAWTRPPM